MDLHVINVRSKLTVAGFSTSAQTSTCDHASARGVDCFERVKSFVTLDVGEHYELLANGVGTNFGVGVGEERPEGSRAGDGVIGEGQPAPPHQQY